MTTAIRSEFARLLGCKPSYITKLIKADRIVFADAEQKLIEVELTKARLAETRDLSKQGVADRHQQRRVEQGVTQYIRTDAPDTFNAGADTNKAGGVEKASTDRNQIPTPGTFNRHLAQARRETYLADMAEIELQKSIGSVLDRSASEAAFETVMIELRQGLSNVKARLPPLFTTDVQKNFVLLDEAIDDALRQAVARCQEQIEKIIADQK